MVTFQASRDVLYVTDQAGDNTDSARADKEAQKSAARRDAEKKRTLRGITKAVSLAAKLSPKSQRKDKDVSNIAELKVCVFSFEMSLLFT